jgi:hypothetical protein
VADCGSDNRIDGLHSQNQLEITSFHTLGEKKMEFKLFSRASNKAASKKKHAITEFVTVTSSGSQQLTPMSIVKSKEGRYALAMHRAVVRKGESLLSESKPHKIGSVRVRLKEKVSSCTD